MRKILLLILLFPFLVFSQKDSSQLGTYTVFKYQNGKISSEGYMKDGKPDNYWKTYYENGVLKSEGNRKNFELDSIWKFYNDSGKVILKINYSAGKKNGLKTTYSADEIIKENYINDIKEGYTYYCYPDEKVRLAVNFIKGKEQGIAREYSQDSTIIALYEYKSGYMISKEKVNRFTNDSLKQGKWVTFFANGILASEGYYKLGIKDGYFKDYFPDGTLKSISKYINGELQVDAPEVTNLDIKTEYYPDGKIKIKGSYKDNIPEGISRYYSPDGKVDSSVVYKKGIIVGDGIVDDNGTKQGPWKEYYDSGELKGEGKYIASQRIGLWKYFYKDGKVEQTGIFLKNEIPDGEWIWYYDNGNKLREETYINGLREGIMIEYSDSNTIVAKGEFVDDLEEGQWYYHEGDIVMEGSYKSGGRDGEWKYFYDNGNPCFKGSFLDDNPNGKHFFYWDNGKVMDEGYYVMGKKEGDWYKYDYTGALFLTTTFKNGIEIKYNGIKIKPPTEDDSGE
jgi:uncharacterized protein